MSLDKLITLCSNLLIDTFGLHHKKCVMSIDNHKGKRECLSACELKFHRLDQRNPKTYKVTLTFI